MKIFASILVRNYSWKLRADIDLATPSDFIPTWQDVKIHIEQTKKRSNNYN